MPKFTIDIPNDLAPAITGAREARNASVPAENALATDAEQMQFAGLRMVQNWDEHFETSLAQIDEKISALQTKRDTLTGTRTRK